MGDRCNCGDGSCDYDDMFADYDYSTPHPSFANEPLCSTPAVILRTDVAWKFVGEDDLQVEAVPESVERVQQCIIDAITSRKLLNEKERIDNKVKSELNGVIEKMVATPELSYQDISFKSGQYFAGDYDPGSCTSHFEWFVKVSIQKSAREAADSAIP